VKTDEVKRELYTDKNTSIYIGMERDACKMVEKVNIKIQ
jgi:hypothetical protein